MKNIKLFGLFILGVFTLASCSKDDDDDGHNHGSNFEYHAHINKPTSETKMLGDTMHIHVDFEDHNGNEVHHVNVRIYNEDTKEEVYSKPDVAHVHEASGRYSFHDDLVLNNDNGFIKHNNYIFVAKVWGHEAGEGLVQDSVRFHVHHQ